MRVKVGNKYYDLVFERNPYCDGVLVDGYCDPPTKPGKRIVLRSSLKKYPERLLCILIHEILHAYGWHLDEEFVTDYCEDSARIAAKLGFTIDVKKVK